MSQDKTRVNALDTVSDYSFEVVENKYGGSTGENDEKCNCFGIKAKDMVSSPR